MLFSMQPRPPADATTTLPPTFAVAVSWMMKFEKDVLVAERLAFPDNTTPPPQLLIKLEPLMFKVALVSAIGAFVTVGIALRLRAQGKPSGLWILSTAILTSPLALLVGPLG